ncbi:MAG TPA: diguanylate cyclase [Synergistetes bacterium]|nr:diguanylate cyclase [Synergistota bacterium]
MKDETRNNPDILNTLFDQFFDYMPEAVTVTDGEWFILRVNTAFSDMFGYSSSDIKGKKIDNVVTPEGRLREEAERFSEATASGESLFEDTFRMKMDGTLIPVSVQTVPVNLDDGKIYFVMYRSRPGGMPGNLGRDEMFSAAMLENSPNPILVINPDTSIRYANRAFELITGYTLDELNEAKAPYPWWTDDRSEKNHAGLLDSFVNGANKIEYLFKKRDGSPFWVEVTGVPVRRNGVLQYYLSNWAEITARKKMEAELGHLAKHDQLTGLYNRHFFNDYIEKELRRSHRFGHPVAFLMVDIDGFKKINDTFGHQTGDAILKEMANLLSRVVRDIDTVVRYGGDEFLIVLVETDGEKELVRQRILAEVELRKPGMDILGYPVTLSIGGSHLEPGEGNKLESALAEADRLMYEEKASKKAQGRPREKESFWRREGL